VLTAVLAVPLARAEVSLPAVFSDHMVLQREMSVPVWGKASPGERITVTFRTQTKSTVADAGGKWKVVLDALEASGPDELVVRGAPEGKPGEASVVTIQDVMVGEVWIGSGQSNMAMGADKYVKGDPVLAANVSGGPYPNLRLLKSGGRWQQATSNSLPQFSALLFSFGLPLQKELNIPVGLIMGAVGGTPSGHWLSPEALKADAACQSLIEQYAVNHQALQVTYDTQTLPKWEAAAAVAKEQGKPAPPRPLPPAKPGQLVKGTVGVLYAAHIQPLIPYGIRGVLWDQGESGTALPAVDQYTLMGALIRGWRKEWALPPPQSAGAPGGDFPFIYVQKPSGGGCAWDAINSVTGKTDRLTALPAVVPNDGKRVETHIRIMRYTNTAMVISSDLGRGTHPVNKSGYGRRAADVALGMVYGRSKEYYGPVYASHQVEGDKIRVRFTHLGQGLAFKPADKPQGFALAGTNGIYRWATASVDGDTVVLTSTNVPRPVSVRYAWSESRTWANLFNQDGLPAIPFQTE
jgi:sialate O-acetylesterase